MSDSSLGRTSPPASPLSLVIAILPAALIGALSFFWLYDLDAMLPPPGDIGASMAGAYALIDGPWTLDPFYTDRISAPEGGSVIYTDALPLIGLVAKAYYGLTGVRWNYMLSWYAFIWIAQAACAAWLLRELGVRNVAALALGSILALAYPPFLYRVAHTAINGHFFILIALALYVRQNRDGHSRGIFAAWLLLLGLLVGLQAYLLAMCVALFAAACLDEWANGRAAFRVMALRFAGTLALLAVLAAGAGYFSARGVFSGGFGTFSMNVLAPFWPVNSGFFGGDHPVTNGGQYEGIQYLGIAVLAAILACAWFGRADLARWARLHPGLLAIFGGLTLFAISNQVWIGEFMLLDLPYPHIFPFTTYRSSGRFFWPVGYALTFFAIAYMYLRLSRWNVAAATALLAAIVVAQCVESWPLARLRGELGHPPSRPVLESAIARATTVSVSPDWDCLANSTDERAMISDLVYLAASQSKPISTAYFNREAKQNCGAPSILSSSGNLMIYLPSSTAAPPAPCYQGEGAMICGAFAREIAASIGAPEVVPPRQ